MGVNLVLTKEVVSARRSRRGLTERLASARRGCRPQHTVPVASFLKCLEVTLSYDTVDPLVTDEGDPQLLLALLRFLLGRALQIRVPAAAPGELKGTLQSALVERIEVHGDDDV